MARLFVGSNFKASRMPVAFFEYLRDLPDEFAICLEFVSPGRKRRQVDCAILGPHGVDVIELKRHEGVITTHPDGQWTHEYNGRIKPMLNRKAGVDENPYEQAQATSDDLVQWVRRQLGKEMAHRPTVFLSSGNPESVIREHSFVGVANGIADLPERLLNLRNNGHVPFYSAEHARITDALGLSELGVTAFYGVVQDGHTQHGISGIQVVVESLAEPLVTDRHGEFSFVYRQGCSISIRIISPGGYHEHTATEHLRQGEQRHYYLLQPIANAGAALKEEVVGLRAQVEELLHKQAGQGAATSHMRAELQRIREEQQAALRSYNTTEIDPPRLNALQAQLDSIQAHIAALDGVGDERSTVLAALDFTENMPLTWRSDQAYLLNDGYADYAAGLSAMTHSELAVIVATLKRVNIANLSADGITSVARQARVLIGRGRDSAAIKSLSARLPKLRFDHASEFLVPHVSALREATAKLNMPRVVLHSLQARITTDVEELQERPRDELEREVTRCLAQRLGVKASADPEYQYRLLLNEISKAFGINERNYTTPNLTQQIYSKVLAEIEENTRRHLRNLTPDQERALVANLDAKLLEMKPDQQRAIMRDLGLDRVSGEILLKSFAGGGVWLGAATAATSTGFGLYLAATTILHAIATTMFGVTLSFGVYSGLTSTLAFLLNPVVTTVVAVTVSGLMLKQGRRLPQKVTGMVLGQILSKRIHEKAMRCDGLSS